MVLQEEKAIERTTREALGKEQVRYEYHVPAIKPRVGHDSVEVMRDPRGHRVGAEVVIRSREPTPFQNKLTGALIRASLWVADERVFAFPGKAITKLIKVPLVQLR